MRRTVIMKRFPGILKKPGGKEKGRVHVKKN